jgi:cupin 2 domain-containing protein
MNLFDIGDIPGIGERFEELLRHRNLVIERIVSSSLITPTNYVQTQDEWVLLLQGEATLKVNDSLVQLKAGDNLFLPAGTPHCVERTSSGATWLAVHLLPDHATRGTSTPPN